MVFIFAFIGLLTQVLIYAIVAWSLLSWVPIRPDNPVRAILGHITEPLVIPLRRAIPPVGRLDLSPIIAILILMAIPYILSFVLL